MTPERLAAVAAAGHLDLDGEQADVEGVDPILASPFALGEVAATALADVAVGAAELSRQAGGTPGRPRTSVAAGAQTIISFGLLRVGGDTVPRTNQSNPFVRAHRCADQRWIFLHGGFPHLQVGLADLLGVEPNADFDEVGRACEQWNALELEDAIAERRLCGGMFRTEAEWKTHPHGEAVNALPTVVSHPISSELRWRPTDPRRPLAGLRVLDLTRVLAGPTCGRTLAALGADVLQVTGPDVPNVPVFVIDTGHGKRRAVANLADDEDRRRLVELAVTADIVVQGYRPGVMRRWGLAPDQLRDDGFAGIHASVSCYGPEGPFRSRAGWEQVAQAVSGIGVRQGSPDAPALVPAAATDYTTGLRLASSLVRALAAGATADMEASLCQTAAWILRVGATLDPDAAVGMGEVERETVESPFGRLQRLGPGIGVPAIDIGWSTPTMPLDGSSLAWTDSSST